MSRTVSVFLTSTIKETEFTDFVTSRGGLIWREDDLDGINVTFADGECNVWIYGARFQSGLELTTLSEQAQASAHEQSQTRIDLVLSHHHDSALLALKLTDEFLCRWPGVTEISIYTALAQGDIAYTLSQTSASDFFGSEVRVLVTECPKLNELIDQFGGLVIDTSDPQLHASAMATALKNPYFEQERDSLVGMISVGMNDIWIMTRLFDPADTCHWSSLAPTVERHLGQTPVSAIRILLGIPMTEDMEPTRSIAMSFAKRASSLAGGALVGLFYVTLELQEVKHILDSGQWSHLS